MSRRDYYVAALPVEVMARPAHRSAWCAPTRAWRTIFEAQQQHRLDERHPVLPERRRADRAGPPDLPRLAVGAHLDLAAAVLGRRRPEPFGDGHDSRDPLGRHLGLGRARAERQDRPRVHPPRDPGRSLGAAQAQPERAGAQSCSGTRTCAHWYPRASTSTRAQGATRSPCSSTSSTRGGCGRPAVTAIPNLFLASDYIQTYTDLATMEGANEAARRAVNGILDARGLGRAAVPRSGTCTSLSCSRRGARTTARATARVCRGTTCGRAARRCRRWPRSSRGTAGAGGLDGHGRGRVGRVHVEDLLSYVRTGESRSVLLERLTSSPASPRAELLARSPSWPRWRARRASSAAASTLAAVARRRPDGCGRRRRPTSWRAHSGSSSRRRSTRRAWTTWTRRLVEYRDRTYAALLKPLPSREPRRYLYDLISGQLSRAGKGPAARPAASPPAGAFGGDGRAGAALGGGDRAAAQRVSRARRHRGRQPLPPQPARRCTSSRASPLAINVGDAMNSLSIASLTRTSRFWAPTWRIGSSTRRSTWCSSRSKARRWSSAGRATTCSTSTRTTTCGWCSRRPAGTRASIRAGSAR